MKYYWLKMGIFCQVLYLPNCKYASYNSKLINFKNQNNNYIKHFSVHVLQRIELMTEESHGRADSSLTVGLNRSNAEATFVQSTMMQLFVKTI